MSHHNIACTYVMCQNSKNAMNTCPVATVKSKFKMAAACISNRPVFLAFYLHSHMKILLCRIELILY